MTTKKLWAVDCPGELGTLRFPTESHARLAVQMWLPVRAWNTPITCFYVPSWLVK